jgi:hypothetical protein
MEDLHLGSNLAPLDEPFQGNGWSLCICKQRSIAGESGQFGPRRGQTSLPSTYREEPRKQATGGPSDFRLRVVAEQTGTQIEAVWIVA